MLIYSILIIVLKIGPSRPIQLGTGNSPSLIHIKDPIALSIKSTLVKLVDFGPTNESN